MICKLKDVALTVLLILSLLPWNNAWAEEGMSQTEAATLACVYTASRVTRITKVEDLLLLLESERIPHNKVSRGFDISQNPIIDVYFSDNIRLILWENSVRFLSIEIIDLLKLPGPLPVVPLATDDTPRTEGRIDNLFCVDETKEETVLGKFLLHGKEVVEGIPQPIYEFTSLILTCMHIRQELSVSELEEELQQNDLQYSKEIVADEEKVILRFSDMLFIEIYEDPIVSASIGAHYKEAGNLEAIVVPIDIENTYFNHFPVF